MPAISHCPHCQASVLIQSLADSSQRLCCPHCAASFAVADAQRAAVEVPPLARPADGGSGAANKPTFETQSPRIVSLEVSYIKAEPPPARSTDRSLASASPAAAEYAIAGAEKQSHAVSGAAEELTAWEAMGQSDLASGRSAARYRSREPKIGVLGHLIGIVLGGVVGLGLGYWILLWIGGRQADFLKVWESMPRWSVPSSNDI